MPYGRTNMPRFAEHRRLDAKAFGITFTRDGHVDEQRARAVLPQLVILEITLSDGGSTSQPSGG
jgi:hypothetical protein